jgi:hypothetical protein
MDIPQFTLFSDFPTEIRLEIWRHAFDFQGPRTVEVRTRPHVCTGHKGWCPRYSPSALPTLMETSLEAREVARGLARAAGHVFFASRLTYRGDDIFLNPAIDTLYIPDEKDPWVRGMDGLLTQFQEMHRTDKVASFATDLKLYGQQGGSVRLDLACFENLRHLVLVVPELNEGVWQQFESVKAGKALLKRQYVFVPSSQHGVEKMYKMHLLTIRLAEEHNGGLRFIEETKP